MDALDSIMPFGDLNTLVNSTPDSLRPLFYSMLWHCTTALLWGTTKNLGPVPTAALVFLLGIAHDMTSYWRQLRPTE